jgi:type II secretory pathway pseudopilin PulG
MLQQKNTNKLRTSFGLIIGICVVIIFFIGFDDIRARVRDTKRQADINEIVKALDIYYDRHGSYPEVTDDDWQGWDNTQESNGSEYSFLLPLYQEKILSSPIVDPLNNSNYFFRYKKFIYGSYQCQSEFYILQIVNFETAQDFHGQGSCPQYNFVEEIPNGFTIMRTQ